MKQVNKSCCKRGRFFKIPENQHYIKCNIVFAYYDTCHYILLYSNDIWILC